MVDLCGCGDGGMVGYGGMSCRPYPLVASTSSQEIPLASHRRGIFVVGSR